MKIVVAISAFKSDRQVYQLITELICGDYNFSSIVVVCSSGGEELAARVISAGYARCEVIPFKTNLGSAGNLLERFKAAERLNADYMLALNHDAKINVEMFKELVNAAATTTSETGALYPLRFKSGKQKYDLTGESKFALRMRGTDAAPERDLTEVFWSSSNGALYALAPFRAGVAPDASLWMGWEDYLYGLQLEAEGYRQYIVSSAPTIDDYEYKQGSLFGIQMKVSDKPLWYLHYSARNMIIICTHKGLGIGMLTFQIVWLPLMAMQILVSKKGHRLRGLRYFISGVLSGILNKSGKWRLP